MDFEQYESLIRTPIRHKPDWENDGSSTLEGEIYYKSTRALGELYRSPVFDHMEDSISEDHVPNFIPPNPFTDPLSQAIKREVELHLGEGVLHTKEFKVGTRIEQAFRQYADELKCIRFVHTLSKNSADRLYETEIVAGTIMGRRDLKKLRKERISRMKDHTASAVDRVRNEIMGGGGENKGVATMQSAWEAWGFSQTCIEDGAYSFGLVALLVLFECLDQRRM